MQKVPTGGEDEKIRVAISDIWSEGFLGSGCNPGCGAHKLQRKLFIFYFHPPSLCSSLSLSRPPVLFLREYSCRRSLQRERRGVKRFNCFKSEYVVQECFDLWSLAETRARAEGQGGLEVGTSVNKASINVNQYVVRPHVVLTLGC